MVKRLAAANAPANMLLFMVKRLAAANAPTEMLLPRQL
jgi:hypothetical protein